MNNQATIPRISVIIPCYNQGQYLDEAVDSVLNQTFKDFEIIIVNDGSTDEYTNTLLNAYQKPKTTIITTENQGLAAARNTGFQASRGQFIQFLDADDLLEPHKFESQLSIFTKHPDTVVCYTDYQYLNSDSKKRIEHHVSLILSIHPFEDFLFLWERKLSIPIHCGLFKRAAWGEELPFISGMRAKEDWVMWIVLARKGYTFYFLEQVHALYRLHSQNMCKNYAYMQFWNMKAAEYIKKNLLDAEYITRFEHEIEQLVGESLKNVDAIILQQAQTVQQQAQQIQQQAQQLEAIENTLSWNITKPLRTLRNHLYFAKPLSSLFAWWNRIKFFIKQEKRIVVCIDRLDLGTEHLDIAGWAISLHDSEGIEHIEVYLDEWLLGNAIYGEERTDVVRRYGGIAPIRNSGFHFSMAIPDFLREGRDAHTVCLRAVGKYGHRTLNLSSLHKNQYPVMPSPQRLLHVSYNQIHSRILQYYGEKTSQYCLHYRIDDYDIFNTVLTLRGWIFSETTSIKSVQLLLTAKENAVCYILSYFRPREDVYAMYHHSHAQFSGFQGHIEISDIQGKVKTHLYVEFESGANETLYLGQMTIVNPLQSQIAANRNAFLSLHAYPHHRVAVYASSVGNYFFSEIRDLIGGGFQKLGFDVELRTETDGFAPEADWHIVVAPHDFFYLGKGLVLRDQVWPLNTILLNTEQSSTTWFVSAYKCFSRAYAIWDMNNQSAKRLSSQCSFVSYFPLGYVPHSIFSEEILQLPEHAGTCFLESTILDRSHREHPFQSRPIDVFFIGHASQRRQEFFAKYAEVFSKYHCYFHMNTLGEPVVPGKTTFMDTPTVIGLEQRSKIILNIHHGDDIYFEWHRIVMHGIWQKALVISEPCSPAPPFQPNKDFVMVALDEIPQKVEFFLTDERGIQEAQAIREHAFKTLTEECRMDIVLRSLLSTLSSEQR